MRAGRGRFVPAAGAPLWRTANHHGITEAEFAGIRALIGDYVSETQRQIEEFTRYRSAGRATSGS
jgi:hypothetical protein